MEDPQSGLFWEMVRIIELIRQVFGYGFKVKFAAENVASMDASAEADVSCLRREATQDARLMSFQFTGQGIAGPTWTWHHWMGSG